MSETRLEKRLSPRAKISRMLRIRRSDEGHFEEMPVSTNVSKHGIYFHTHLPNYHKGMRLFITYPFTFANDPLKSEYLAEVVRIDDLPDGKRGIAIHLRSSI